MALSRRYLAVGTAAPGTIVNLLGGFPELHTPVPTETPFDQTFCGRIDISYVGITNQ